MSIANKPKEYFWQHEWMEGCTHRDACQRIYQTFVDPTEHFGWMDDMARILRCHDCECWED